MMPRRTSNGLGDILGIFDASATVANEEQSKETRCQKHSDCPYNESAAIRPGHAFAVDDFIRLRHFTKSTEVSMTMCACFG